MKTGLSSALYVGVCSLAIILCFVPFLFLGFKKVRQVNTYRVIGIYWFLNGLVNLPMLRPIQHESIRIFFSRFSDFYDLADAPLMLFVFALANAGAQNSDPAIRGNMQSDRGTMQGADPAFTNTVLAGTTVPKARKTVAPPPKKDTGWFDWF